MKITHDDDFGGAVLNCAVRYALGRTSYMPGLVMDVIRPMLKDCSYTTLYCMRKDVSAWLKDNSVLSMGYVKEWHHFLDDVKEEIERRKAGE